MTIVAILDANVLYSARLRDLMVRFGRAGLFRPLWTDRILNECFGAILRGRPELAPSALARTRELLARAVPDVLVEGYEAREADLSLPDERDRHVLAAAIHGGASVIVTANTADFPLEALARVGIIPQHPDAFALRLVRTDTEAVQKVLSEQALALRNPPTSVEDLLDRLVECGLTETVKAVRSFSRPPAPGTAPSAPAAEAP